LAQADWPYPASIFIHFENLRSYAPSLKANPEIMYATFAFADVMWKTQQTLHGQSSTLMFPAGLVALAAVLILYKHFLDDTSDTSTKTFLALIIVQMLPLVFLEKKILSCPDPVSMLSRFGTKVLLMHALFLLLRIAAWPLMEVGLGVCNLMGLVAVCAALHFGFNFRLSLASAVQNADVIGLLLLGAGAGFLTEVVDFHNHKTLLEATIHTSANYIEILAFVPAVWMVHQTSKKSDDLVEYCEAPVEKQAAAFFAFLVSWYVMEDLVSAYRVHIFSPMAAAGHLVHFALVLDFACFLLAHIYNPEKLPSTFRRWLPDQWV